VVGYEVLAGNVRDHKTVAGMLQRLGAQFGLADRTLCMDRGMVTEDSLKLIRESTVRYVLADRRGASERFPEQVQQGPWQTKRADPDTGEAMVEVQEVGAEEGDRLILVRSRGCAQKEKGIHDRMLSKLKAHLERLQNTVSKGRLVNPQKIDRRIGSILARHPGMSSWVCVRREELPAATGDKKPKFGLCVEKPSQLPPRGTKPSRPARRIGQFPFHPFHRFIARHDHLGDPVAGAHGVRLAAQIQQNHAQFAAITGVDGARRIGHGDGVLQRQPATRTHLRLIPRRDFHCQTGRHHARHARFQGGVFHRAQVHPGVFLGPVGVCRQHRVRPQLLYSYSHPVIITSRLNRPRAFAPDIPAGYGSRGSQELVIAEVALSIVPLACGGLMLRSFLNLAHVPIGFDPTNVLTAKLPISFRMYPETPQRWAVLREILGRVAAMPGVEQVSAASPLPLEPAQISRRAGRADRPGVPGILATEQVAIYGYPRLVGTALLEGRDFTPEDIAAARPVAIVDERLARRLWPEGALGKRLAIERGSTRDEFEVIGVTVPVRATRVRDENIPHFVIPYPLYPIEMTLVVKTRETAASLGPALRFENATSSLASA
jgi:hypothetical protein